MITQAFISCRLQILIQDVNNVYAIFKWCFYSIFDGIKQRKMTFTFQINMALGYFLSLALIIFLDLLMTAVQATNEIQLSEV